MLTHLQAQCQCPKLGQVEQIHLGMGRSICQLLLRPHAPNTFWRFQNHIEIFLDHLGGVDPPVGRVLVPNYEAKLSKYMGEGEVNISASIRAPCTKYFLEISETHRNMSRVLVMC